MQDKRGNFDSNAKKGDFQSHKQKFSLLDKIIENSHYYKQQN